MTYNEITYNRLDIKLLDIHILLTKLIYFTKTKNKTLKKEYDKFYIKTDDWEEINLEDLNLKVLQKQREVLITLKSSSLLKDKEFRRTIGEHLYDSDYNLKFDDNNMEFELTPAKFNMLSKLLDYELRNTDFELKHLENI